LCSLLCLARRFSRSNPRPSAEPSLAINVALLLNEDEDDDNNVRCPCLALRCCLACSPRNNGQGWNGSHGGLPTHHGLYQIIHGRVSNLLVQQGCHGRDESIRFGIQPAANFSEHDKPLGTHGKFVEVVFEIPHKQHGHIHVTQCHIRVLLEQFGYCHLDLIGYHLGSTLVSNRPQYSWFKHLACKSCVVSILWARGSNMCRSALISILPIFKCLDEIWCRGPTWPNTKMVGRWWRLSWNRSASVFSSSSELLCNIIALQSNNLKSAGDVPSLAASRKTDVQASQCGKWWAWGGNGKSRELMTCLRLGFKFLWYFDLLKHFAKSCDRLLKVTAICLKFQPFAQTFCLKLFCLNILLKGATFRLKLQRHVRLETVIFVNKTYPN
jgi:hypothetical protein